MPSDNRIERGIVRKPVQLGGTDPFFEDLAHYNVSDHDLERVCHALKAVPVSEFDDVIGGVRRRQLGGWIVLFQVLPGRDVQYVDICGIRPPTPIATEDRLKAAFEKYKEVRENLGVFGV